MEHKNHESFLYPSYHTLSFFFLICVFSKKVILFHTCSSVCGTRIAFLKDLVPPISCSNILSRKKSCHFREYSESKTDNTILFKFCLLPFWLCWLSSTGKVNFGKLLHIQNIPLILNWIFLYMCECEFDLQSSICQ